MLSGNDLVLSSEEPLSSIYFRAPLRFENSCILESHPNYVVYAMPFSMFEPTLLLRNNSAGNS